MLFGFRDSFPQNPSKQQLDELFLQADDSRQNTLVLKIDGLFHFVPPDILYNLPNDPEVIVMFANIEEDLDNTGPGMPAEALETDILAFYSLGMRYWRDHLVSKRLHHFSKDETEDLEVDDLLDIFSDLKLLKELDWFRATYSTAI